MTVQPYNWSPFPADGEWTRDTSWQPFIACLAGPTRATDALGALRTVFPPPWIARHGASLPPHPLGIDYTFRGSRFDLLELGVALSELAPRKVAGRLRSAAEYRSTRAELQTGLILRCANAVVEHEPSRPATGPDWGATWPGGRLGVEVKCMKTSGRSEALGQLEVRFHWQFMAGLAHCKPTHAAWLTIEIDPAVLNDLMVGGTFLRAGAIEALAAEAAKAAQESMPRPTAEGTYSMGRAGRYRIKFGPQGDARFHFDGHGLDRDAATEYQRTRDELQRAASQLAAVDAPGLVVLDMGRDSLLTNHFEAVREEITTETWAARLAGVLFVDRVSSATTSHCIVHCAAGPLGHALEDTLLPGLRVCERGHLHADTVLRRSATCDLAGW